MVENSQSEDGERYMFEGQDLTTKLKEKLTVQRPFYERAFDWLTDFSLSDIRNNKYVTGLVLGAAAIIIAIPFMYRARFRELAEKADAKTHLVAPEIDNSSIDSYLDDVQEAASMGGAPPTAIEALLYACQNCPEYMDFAKASGKAGIIPLDPAEAGVLPGILENDDELCLQVASEMYGKIRAKTHTDIEALAAVLSSWDEYDAALTAARKTEVQYQGGRGRTSPDSFKLDLQKHEETFRLLEKHKRGELTEDEYWGALVSYGGEVGFPYERNKKNWKMEFERIIAEGNQTGGLLGGSDKDFIIYSQSNPGIRLMTEEAYAREKAIFDSFEDFTTRLPDPVAKAVDLARAYLKQ